MLCFILLKLGFTAKIHGNETIHDATFFGEVFNNCIFNSIKQILLTNCILNSCSINGIGVEARNCQFNDCPFIGNSKIFKSNFSHCTNISECIIYCSDTEYTHFIEYSLVASSEIFGYNFSALRNTNLTYSNVTNSSLYNGSVTNSIVQYSYFYGVDVNNCIPPILNYHSNGLLVNLTCSPYPTISQTASVSPSLFPTQSEEFFRTVSPSYSASISNQKTYSLIGTLTPSLPTTSNEGDGSLVELESTTQNSDAILSGDLESDTSLDVFIGVIVGVLALAIVVIVVVVYCFIVRSGHEEDSSFDEYVPCEVTNGYNTNSTSLKFTAPSNRSEIPFDPFKEDFSSDHEVEYNANSMLKQNLY